MRYRPMVRAVPTAQPSEQCRAAQGGTGRHRAAQGGTGRFSRLRLKTETHKEAVPPIDQGGTRWCMVVQGGTGRCKVVQGGAERCRAVQGGTEQCRAV